MATADEENAAAEAVSPRQPAPAAPSFGPMNNNHLESLDLRADPDAQATVTDFLDFTDYLPSDMMRSLTLIGKLDQAYSDASTKVHHLTTTWGQLPSLPPEERPAPVQLRADISEQLSRAVNSRIYSHAEAVRMAENVNRHCNRIKTILSKLKIMRENYPAAEEQKSPAAPKSPQMMRAPKITVRMEGGGQKLRRQRVPRITVPGEVLAPYELNYESCSDESDISSSSSSEDEPLPVQMSQTRIRLIKNNKSSKPKPARTTSSVPVPMPAGLSTSIALAQLKPPPEDAVPGSADAPWLQLTPYELAKLRKRMKKNAQWTPSETMIARELKQLSRGFEAWKAAKTKAEEEGRPFENNLPVPIIDADGVAHPPLGALSIDAAVAAEDKQNTNRGMKLNEAKKLKKENLAQLAAKEAEESTRRMMEAARAMYSQISTDPSQTSKATTKSQSQSQPQAKKRKRERGSEGDAERQESAEAPKQQPKRTKTETPVPIPQPVPNNSAPAHGTPVPPPQLTPSGSTVKPHSTTPVPVPIPGQEQSLSATKSSSSSSPQAPDTSGPSTATAMVASLKVSSETPIPPPLLSPKKSITPILPPTRETRTREAARKEQQQHKETQAPLPLPASSTKPTSRATTPAAPNANVTAAAATAAAAAAATAVAAAAPTQPPPPHEGARRPQSRGKAMSQEPQPSSLAADRPRRASTARNTPAPPEHQSSSQQPQQLQGSRMPVKRPKRPAPGVVSRTSSGGNSAVGRRKAAPKKKNRGAPKKDKAAEDEDEVDDDGNVIDPEEPRYCLCNRVSFGTMIQCDNVEVWVSFFFFLSFFFP